ncbi:MBL fold metallo-hydrolase [Paraburkholderia xenovorans]|uniref:MBL fold metallo-hydrolase n=1 Tax=Paraburkholderia xenovorans TaxID=36873 RepID=UPI0038B70066
MCNTPAAIPTIQQADDTDPIALHHAKRTPSGFENNYTQLIRRSFLRWQWEKRVHGYPKPAVNGYAFPGHYPDVSWLKQNRTVDTLTWIGHASALVQIQGVNILTDPVFSDRASPFSFTGPRRKVEPALSIEQLPHIDLVLISHNHYDHLDAASVVAINAQRGGPPLFLVPMGVKSWMTTAGIENACELDWGDHVESNGLEVWFVPAQHWSARTLFDRAQTLWGGWVAKTRKGASRPFSFYFAGDTGYSKDFKDIGAAFGGFDLALIPIGAYAPRWFMEGQHVDPAQAVQIFQDVKAKRAIGIHWGTFPLAGEPFDEPPRLLKEATRKAGLADNLFSVLHHGETLRLGADDAR